MRKSLILLLILNLAWIMNPTASMADMTPATAYTYPDGHFNPKAGKSDQKKEVEQSYQLAKEFFLSAQLKNGAFLYLYNPATGKASKKNDMLRQLMATRLLAELAAENEALVEKHKKNMEFVLRHWYREDYNGLGFCIFYGESELGANAIFLMALISSPLYEKYQGIAEKTALGIKELQNEDGSFEPYFILPSYPFDREYNMAFYSGEATLAFLKYYEKTRDKKWLDYAIKAQDYYIDKYVKKLKDNYYPAYVPWQTFCLSNLYFLTKDKKYAEAAFVLNDKLLEIQEKTGNPGRFFDRDYSRYGGTHSSSDGIYTESLAYALLLAKKEKDVKRQKIYSNALSAGLENLISLQYRLEPSKLTEGKKSIKGAFRIRDDDGRIRIDSTQHIMDAYRKALNVW